MRRTPSITLIAAALMLMPGLAKAQEQVRSVPGGGISAPGWAGKIDANEARRGRTLNDAKLAKEGNALHVTTCPSI